MTLSEREPKGRLKGLFQRSLIRKKNFIMPVAAYGLFLTTNLPWLWAW